MDPVQRELVVLLFRIVYVLGGALCGSLMHIWRSSRQKRYLREALAREQQYASSRAERNSRIESKATRETTGRLLTKFLQEPRPTLQRLAEDTETDFTLRR